MAMNPALAGFVKGLLLVLAAAFASYLSDSANLTPLIGTSLAALVAAVASAIESQMKANTGGKLGLFGAVKIK